MSAFIYFISGPPDRIVPRSEQSVGSPGPSLLDRDPPSPLLVRLQLRRGNRGVKEEEEERRGGGLRQEVPRGVEGGGSGRRGHG